jgi:hypothetical protein
VSNKKLNFFTHSIVSIMALSINVIPMRPYRVFADILHNLRIVLRAQEGMQLVPNTISDLMRLVTRKYVEFFSATELTEEFLRLYGELGDGYAALLEINDHLTLHKVPYRVKVVIRILHLLNPTDVNMMVPFRRNDCWVTERKRADGGYRECYVEKYSPEYIALVRSRTGLTPEDGTFVRTDGIVPKLNAVYTTVHNTVQAHMNAVFSSTDFHAVHSATVSDSSTAPSPVFKNPSWRFLEPTMVTNDVVHHFFAYVAAAQRVQPIEGEVTVRDLIDMELPGETDLEKEIRRELRIAAHIDPDRRYLLSMLYLTHADGCVQQRGLVLMRSAAADGSARATTYLSSAAGAAAIGNANAASSAPAASSARAASSAPEASSAPAAGAPDDCE